MQSSWKITAVRGCVSAISTGIGMLIGDLWGAVLIAIGIAGLLATAAAHFVPQITILGFGRIPMSKASARMFIQAKPETKKFVSGNSTIDVYKRPENYFANELKQRGRKRQIEIWGRRSTALSLEKLDPTDLALGMVIDGDRLVSSTNPSQAPTWVDLKVKWEDAAATLKQFEDSLKR